MKITNRRRNRKPIKVLTPFEKACKHQEELENIIDDLEEAIKAATDEDTIDELTRELEHKREELEAVESYLYEQEIADLNRDYMRSVL